MKTSKQRGVVQGGVLIVIGVLAVVAWLNPKWALPAFMQKKPPVAELTAAQADLAKAKAAQAAAESALAAAQADKDRQTQAQLRYSQQMANGAAEALNHVPAEHQTPETALAGQLVGRASAGLDAAIGKLSPELQAEIRQIVKDSLSSVTAERDQARSALAVKDAALQAEITAKAQLAAKIPVLEASVTREQAATAVVQAKVDAKAKEVTVWAAAKAEADRKAGSLEGYAGNLWRIIKLLGLLYVFGAWVLPSLAAEFPGSAVLTWMNKTVKSVTTAHP